LAQYAQDLFQDWDSLRALIKSIKGKGFTGATGTSAAYAELLGDAGRLPEFERRLSEKLGLEFYPVSTQVYPRKQDYQVLSALAGLGASLHKFAFDIRILQSPLFGEVSEPFGKKQVGSSAMPFKRNPVNAEKIDSLARSLAQMPRQAWDNAALSLLERTLDDSANRRTFLPEAFLTADELLQVSSRVLKNLTLIPEGMAQNLRVYGPFAAVERVLMALAKSGADRQEMHERLRIHAMEAWSALQNGQPNPLAQRLMSDEHITQYIPMGEIEGLMDASRHLGDAPQRARALADRIRSAIM